MAYKMGLNVRGYHCDAYGHVNNARYLEMFEEARWLSLDESGVGERAEARGYLFFIVQINVSFKLPVENGEKITISTSLSNHTRRTITFHQVIHDTSGKLKTEAFVTFVLFNPKSNSSVPIKDDILAWFKSFQNGEN